MLGSRDPEKLDDWVKSAGPGASAGSFAEAATFGAFLVLATLGTVVEDVIDLADAKNFEGKLVIDVTNPLDNSTGKPRLAWGFDDSNGERIQQVLPLAHVVKAFNTVGHGLFVHPNLPSGPPTMFIAGDEPGPKKQVEAILADFGWETADIGDIESSRFLEPMCLAWINYGITSGNWAGHAYKLLKL